MESNKLTLSGKSQLQVIGNQFEITDKLISNQNEIHAQIFLAKGLKDVEHRNYPNAIKNFTRAINANPKLEKAYTNRGKLYMYDRKWNEAEIDFSTAIELNPTDDTYINRAKYYRRIKQYKDEFNDYISALSINPLSAKALLNLISEYKYLKDFDKALEICNKYIVVNPSSLSYSIRAEVNFICKNYQQAILDITESINLRPSAKSYEFRAEIYKILKMEDKYESDIKRLLNFPKTTSS